jgi:hypothetical protein
VAPRAGTGNDRGAESRVVISIETIRLAFRPDRITTLFVGESVNRSLLTTRRGGFAL